MSGYNSIIKLLATLVNFDGIISGLRVALLDGLFACINFAYQILRKVFLVAKVIH